MCVRGGGELTSVPGFSLFKMAVKGEKQLDGACAWKEPANCAGTYSVWQCSKQSSLLPNTFFFIYSGYIQRGTFQGSKFNGGCQVSPHD